jgi:ATP adenylyltransferase
MKRVWSPWRSQYIEQLNENIQTFQGKENKKEEDNATMHRATTKDCFICNAINSTGKDKELLIVARREKCIIIMNKYPYNSGHTLICPLRHISQFEDFENDELMNIMNTSQEIIVAIKSVLAPHGFNFGINIGQSAGAGLPSHLHFHIVPRWNGDSNFTASIADVKFYPDSLEDTRIKLARILNI